MLYIPIPNAGSTLHRVFFFAQTGHPMRCIYANINKLPLRTIHGQHNMLSSPLCSPSPMFRPFSPQVRDSRLARRSSTRAPPHNGHARNTREHRAARALLRERSLSLCAGERLAQARAVCANTCAKLCTASTVRGDRGSRRGLSSLCDLVRCGTVSACVRMQRPKVSRRITGDHHNGLSVLILSLRVSECV